MTELSPEAYAIIEGRHSDPFHYLGLHDEGDRHIVRAFLPEASKVEAVVEHGETAAAAAPARDHLRQKTRGRSKTARHEFIRMAGIENAIAMTGKRDG